MRKLLPSIGMLLLVGCTDPYVRPDAPVAASWSNSSAPQDARPAAQIAWQEFFPDPRLRTLIEAAFEHNRELKIAVARLEEARVQYGMARAERLPAINANLSQSAQSQSQEVAGAGNDTLSRRFDVGLGMVSYEIDLWNRLGNISEAARASMLASDSARRGVRLGLIGEVAGSYFSLLELDERRQLAREMANLQAQVLALVELASQEGFASNLEKLTARNTLETTRNEIAQLERQHALASNKLELLVGRMPANLPAGLPLAEQTVGSTLAPGLPAETLLARPDVMEAEQRLQAAQANIAAARAAFLPKILLTAGLGLASPSLASLFASSGQGAWNFQPSVSLPIFDWGRTQGGVDLATARRNVAVAEYEKALQTAFREVADLLASRQSLAEQQRVANARFTLQQERVQTLEARQREGFASLMNVLEARRELLSVQQDAMQAQRQQLENAALLYKALGGGESLVPLNAAANLPPVSLGSLHSPARPGGT